MRPFEGTRYSLVFYTCDRFQEATFLAATLNVGNAGREYSSGAKGLPRGAPCHVECRLHLQVVEPDPPGAGMRVRQGP